MSFSVAICCVLLEKSLWRTSTCFHQPRTSMHFCPSVRMFDCRRKWVPVGWTTGRIVFFVLGPIGAKQLRLLASSALIHVYPYINIYIYIYPYVYGVFWMICILLQSKHTPPPKLPATPPPRENPMGFSAELHRFLQLGLHVVEQFPPSESHGLRI